METKTPENKGQTAERPILLDEGLWESFNEMNEGQAVCYQCGACTARCPWGEVRTRPLPVRSMMRAAQIGIYNNNPEIWLCTTCGQCEPSCPRGVKIPEIIQWMRGKAWERSDAAGGLPTLLWSIYWNGNPWSQPPSQRARHILSLGVPVFDSRIHEICLYVGCTASYDRLAQKSVSALAKLLNAAGVKFGCLGENEPCCGEAALSVGHEPFFSELVKKAAQVFIERGVREIVTISPHCFDVFKNHYPSVTGTDEVVPVHYTQYLSRLLEEGRLSFNEFVQSSVDKSSRTENTFTPSVKAVFQDPCYLGRRNGEYEAPRNVLTAIAGVELVEMEDSREDGLCCGGGGGRMWLETPRGERFSDKRINDAVDTGASYLVTACPFCRVCLEDSRKSLRVNNLRVVDLAEMAAAYLESPVEKITN